MVAKVASDLAGRAGLILAVVLILRNGGADDLGAWSQLLVIVSLLSPFAVLGLGYAVVPFFAPRTWDSATRRRAAEVLALAGATSCIAAIGVALTASLIGGSVLDWPRSTDLFRAGSGLLWMTGLQWLVLFLLQSRSRLTTYVVLQVADGAGLTVLAVVILPRSGVIGLVVGLSIWRGLLVLVGAALALRGTHAGGSDPPPPAISQIARFGIGVVAADLGAWTVNLADRLVYGHYGSARELGAYSAIYTATGLIAVTGAAVFLAAYPRIARAWPAGGPEGTRRVVRRFHSVLSLTLPPLVVFLLVITGPAIAVIDQGDVDPGFAVVALVVLAIGINQFNGLSRLVLIVTEGSRSVLPAWTAGALVTIFASLALIPRIGLVGAAMSTAASFMVVDAMLAIRAHRRIDLLAAYDWATARRSAVAAAISAIPAALLVAALPGGFATLTYASVAYWATYLITAPITGAFPRIALVATYE